MNIYIMGQIHNYTKALRLALSGLLFGALAFPAAVRGESPVDSAKVYFPLGHRQYYPDYKDNDAAMGHFLRSVREADSAGAIDRVEVRAYASPDGSNAANERLTANRCRSISDYIVSETGIAPGLIDSHAEGIAWHELRRMVAADGAVPYQAEVLEVLDNIPVWVFDDAGAVVGGRKKALMDLRGGVPYRWLYEYVFPVLRNAVAVSLYLKGDAEVPEQPVAATEATDSGDTAETAGSGTDVREVIADYDAEAAPAPATEQADVIHAFALKTNLIYDALLCPNLALEWRINDKWSVAAEADVAWWRNDGRHRYYQLMYIGGEGRYWFKTRGPWHGMYAGVMAGGGKYDLSGGHRGYKGEAGLAGLTYGYMFPVSKHLSFDAEIGLGYMYTEYKEYIPHDGHYLYQRTARTGYFGPVKVQFSLVWRFGDSARIWKGGRK